MAASTSSGAGRMYRGGDQIQTIACQTPSNVTSVRSREESVPIRPGSAGWSGAGDGIVWHWRPPDCHHRDPGRAKNWERGGGEPLFRSYAGMTRIRFKGPAHRHLSVVRRPPRNGVIYSGKGNGVKVTSPDSANTSTFK